MTYDVEIPFSIREKIFRWDLPAGFIAEVLENVEEELRVAPPEGIGRRVVAPVRCAIFRVTLPHPTDNDDYAFTFWINDTASEGIRYVIDAAYRPVA